ncbi:GNAT family N-acetyltransferase [Pengzhenrongella sicca]|uniref:GNAT family N-acetyltransferase n=1 Tax=Pengzhenrongella sicca TaxID=2819238 RepID=A0A8A4ZFE6_9MICO|nr:GNAT family N-acetyltransferase [Pengzhenrongella sicca]QTE30722.1 GNAT family N-acetyltransferase [Pengzhenrongella sicca]
MATTGATSPRIRAYAPRDWAALYDVCLRTGADGADASGQYTDPRLLGSVYAGPYVAFEPELAFVLDDGERVQGYVLGALDTTSFERRCEREWWPALRERYPAAAWAPGSADGEVVALLHDPPTADPAVTALYPSHLHIDLLPAAQGTGFGRRLIETFTAAARAAGSPGVHLVVSRTNTNAVGFYRRMSFVELDGPAEPGAGVTMGLRIGSISE